MDNVFFGSFLKFAAKAYAAMIVVYLLVAVALFSACVAIVKYAFF